MTRARYAMLLLWPWVALAQTPAREGAIKRIQKAYAQVSLFTPDSPFSENLLSSAKAVHPGVDDDVWATIKPELAAAVFSGAGMQRAFMKAMWGDAARISAAINTVLTNHGLKEVH